MDYKIIFIVGVLLALPTIVLVISKLVVKVRQARLGSTAFSRDATSGEVEFGDAESGKRPATSNGEAHDAYGSGGGDSQSTDSCLSAKDVFDYLEDAVTCSEPSGKETIGELLDENSGDKKPLE